MDLIAGLQTSVEERQAALKAKQTELTELQGKKIAHTLLPQIERRVSDAKWVSKSDNCQKQPDGCSAVPDGSRQGSERGASQ